MEGWIRVELEKVCSQVGSNYQPKESSNLPYVGLEHIESEKSMLTNHGFESEIKSSKTRFNKGQILYGKLRPYLDKAVIAPFDGICSTDILVFDSNTESMNEFLIHLIHSNEFIDHAKATTNGVQHPRTSWNSLKQFKFLLPPLPEQRKIAHVLSTVRKAIEQQDKLIRATTELKKAIMQKLFTEGTRGEPQRETEIGLAPVSWEVVRIKKYILKTKNRDPRKEPEKDFVYVDVSSVSNEFFRIENTLKICGKEAPSRARKIIQDGDVIFATVRPTLKRIAKISQEYHNQICSTGYCVLKPDPDKLSQEYLYQYLQTEFFIERIEKLQRGASYPAVRDTDVKSIYIPLPILSEQKEIGKTLNILDLKNDVLINKKQTLTDLFKTLLHELMTGQRRVHKLEFENMEEF